MSHVEEGGKGKRKMGEELNLVPFIDLMSVLITFLLITAVWSQVNMMQIGSSIYGKKTENPNEPPPPPKPSFNIVLKLDIKKTGYVLTAATDIIQIPLAHGEFDDETLKRHLERTKQRYPEKTDALMSVADDVKYDRLIKGMDALLNSGFPQLAVATGGPE